MHNIIKYLVVCGSYAVVVVFLTPHSRRMWGTALAKPFYSDVIFATKSGYKADGRINCISVITKGY